MTAPETWRIECADGVVREVSMVHRPDRTEAWVPDGHWPAAHHAPHLALTHYATLRGWPVVAILAPGEQTTAQRVAAAVAAEREACAATCRDIASDAADDSAVSETADACAEAIDARGAS